MSFNILCISLYIVFTERECTDLKKKLFFIGLIFIIYIKVVVTDGSVIQYLVYFCCCVDNINFNRDIIMKNYCALGRVTASV